VPANPGLSDFYGIGGSLQNAKGAMKRKDRNVIYVLVIVRRVQMHDFKRSINKLCARQGERKGSLFKAQSNQNTLKSHSVPCASLCPLRYKNLSQPGNPTASGRGKRQRFAAQDLRR
jgi:hypothetical protein